jgi:hypothetical protein
MPHGSLSKANAEISDQVVESLSIFSHMPLLQGVEKDNPWRFGVLSDRLQHH